MARFASQGTLRLRSSRVAVWASTRLQHPVELSSHDAAKTGMFDEPARPGRTAWQDFNPLRRAARLPRAVIVCHKAWRPLGRVDLADGVMGRGMPLA